MPASYRIDPHRRLVRVRVWGTVTNDDLRDHYHRLAADSRFEPTFRSIADLDAVTRFAVDPCVIAETASWSIFDVGTRRAIVAASDVALGLSRMFSLYAEGVGQNVRVFRTEPDALSWLNSPIQLGQEPDFLDRHREPRLETRMPYHGVSHGRAIECGDGPG